MTRLSCGAPRVFHAGFNRHALVINLPVKCTSSVPWVFNHTSTHDKSTCNKGDTRQIIDFHTRECAGTRMCRHACVKFKLSCNVLTVLKAQGSRLSVYLHEYTMQWHGLIQAWQAQVLLNFVWSICSNRTVKYLWAPVNIDYWQC